MSRKSFKFESNCFLIPRLTGGLVHWCYLVLFYLWLRSLNAVPYTHQVQIQNERRLFELRIHCEDLQTLWDARYVMGSMHHSIWPNFFIQQSRERSQASSSRHRSNRERSSTSQNSRPVSNPSSQQMLLTSSHPQPSQTHHHHHNVPYQSTSVTSPLTQSNAAPNPSTQYPPTLVVNLPPADNPPQLHDPPPPYPGLPKASAPPLNGGPSHGYGEGRGHYNRQGQTNVPTSVKPPGPKSNVKKSEPESSKSRRS